MEACRRICVRPGPIFLKVNTVVCSFGGEKKVRGGGGGVGVGCGVDPELRTWCVDIAWPVKCRSYKTNFILSTILLLIAFRQLFACLLAVSLIQKCKTSNNTCTHILKRTPILTNWLNDQYESAHNNLYSSNKQFRTAIHPSSFSRSKRHR